MKHLLIDFENTQPADLNKIQDDDCQIWLFLGLHQQKNIPLDLCESLLRFGKNVHFVRLEKSGKNALDFYLAFYMGRITQTDPEAEICILSKDGGFDPLVAHVSNQNMAEKVVRVKELAGKTVKMLGGNSKVGAYQAASHILPQTENTPARSGFKKAIVHFSEAKPPFPATYEQLLKTLRKLLKADLKTQAKEERAATVGKIAEKLLQEGFIRADSEQNLQYHFSRADFEQRLIKRILTLKPRSRTALFNVMKGSIRPEQEWNESEGEQTLNKLMQLNIFTLRHNKISYPDDTSAEAEIVEAEIIDTPNPPAAKPHTARANTAAFSDATRKALAILQKINRNKPVSQKSLQNSIVSWLQINAEEAAVVFDELLAHGIIELIDNRIHYSLK